MKKAVVIPKAIAAGVALLISLILAMPVLPMMTARMFGGGTIDFNESGAEEYSANRPMAGVIHYVLGASGDEDVYYYLVPLKGSEITSKSRVDTLVLFKVKNGSEVYNSLNDVYRESTKGNGSFEGFRLSGVVKKMSPAEKKTAGDIQDKTPFYNLKLCDYTVDLSSSVGSMTFRFVLSVLFLLAAIFSGVIALQAIKKNESIDRIEIDRIAFKREQEAKSGNKNDDGSDKMFGDSDASYGVTPRKEGGNDMLGETSAGGSGGFKPAFQSQGGEEDYTPRSGGGFLDVPDDDDSPSFFGGSSSQGGGYYDDSQQDGFFGGGSGGFYGNDSQNDADYDGFFGG